MDIHHIVKAGETIEDYPTDTPYPSRLIMGWSGNRPLHIVVADNPDAGETIIITAYEPDAAQWSADFRRTTT